MAAPRGAPPATEKKGEVNELRTLLRTVNTDKDSKRKRDVIKKVIAYMTLGIDVSRLFSDMILACNTRDLVVKKMVYLFLCAHAQTNAELTLLAINTLQKDCRDEDPMVRGLALRSLTGLRLFSILEYVMAPLRASLSDSSGYVRQAGVVGVLKVFHLAPQVVKDEGFVDLLYSMMRDREPQVVINCLSVLNEVLAEEGGIAINQAIIHYLLTRLREFSDWGQCIVLELVAKYKTESEDELFGIMNLLDPHLKVANSAVVLACTKCFLALTASLPEIQHQVYLRLKTPLLTILASSSNEVAYPVLSHVLLIIGRANAAASAAAAAAAAMGVAPAPGVFDDEFKQFFCKYNEPTCCKSLKMSILPKVANASTAREVVSELSEYVGGVDAELARQAVRAIGEIAVRVPPAAELVVESLLEALEMEAEYVRAETVVVMQDILRKYPDRASSVIPSLHRVLKRMEDPQGRAAVIWMIGEYGHLIEDAPYLLEPLIDGISPEDAVTVRNELLTATVKLFFKRPPEVQRMLGRLFKAYLADGVTASVRDRALLYYRLLRTDVAEASAVIGGDKPPVAEFHDEQGAEVRAKIWSEFNSLSVVYGKPSQEFISLDHLITPLDAPAAAGVGGAAAAGAPAPAAAASDDTSLLSAADAALPRVEGVGAGSAGGAAPAYGAGGAGGFGGGGGATAAPEVDLLGGDDLLGIGGGPGSAAAGSSPASAAGGYGPGAAGGGFGMYGAPAAPAPAPSAAAGLGLAGLYGAPAPAPAPAAVSPGAAFRAGAVLDAAAYQARWGALPVTASAQLRGTRVPPPSDLEALLRASHVNTIASGDVGSAVKLYLFAVDAAAGSLHMWEVVADKGTGVYAVTQKSENAGAAQGAAQGLAAALRPVLA